MMTHAATLLLAATAAIVIAILAGTRAPAAAQPVDTSQAAEVRHETDRDAGHSVTPIQAHDAGTYDGSR